MDTAKLKTVKVERDDGITWVILNRPEKRNAMSPEMHFEMDELLRDLEHDPATKCVILTGAGAAFCAGQDLKLFFREAGKDPAFFARAAEAADRWRWQRLYNYDKPTIAMINGYCVGGAFMQLIACDFAIADEDAVFSLSEVNWGGMPASLVTRAVTEAVGYRDAIDICLGRPFDGREADRMRLVNQAVPAAGLRDVTVAKAREIMAKDPAAVQAAKQAVRMVRDMSFTQAYDYLDAKTKSIRLVSGNRYQEGHKQFLDDKSYKPTFGTFRHGAE